MTWGRCGRLRSWPVLSYYTNICLEEVMGNTKTISQDNPTRYRGWRQLKGCGTLFYWNEHITGVGVNITVHLFMPENIYIYFFFEFAEPTPFNRCLHADLPTIACKVPTICVPPAEARPGRTSSRFKKPGVSKQWSTLRIWLQVLSEQSISSLIEMLS
jgi:hypothetical protein